MSEVLGSMTGLELREDSAGRAYWYDKEENKRVSVRIALGHMGVDSDQRQEPVQAIWQSKERDFPVTIVGIQDRVNDEDILIAKETKMGIPRSELVFTPMEAPLDKDEYIRRLEADNNLLATELSNVKADLEGLRREFRDFMAETKSEEAGVESVAEEPVSPGPARAEEHKDERIFPGSLIDVDWPDGEKGRGLTAVSGIWKDPRGNEHITYMSDEGPRWAPFENVSIHEDVWEPEPVVATPLESITPAGYVATKNAPLSWRERMSDWLTLRRPVTYLQTRRPVDGGEVEEVEVTEERTNPVIAGAAFLGGLAIAGFIGYELGKHSGHDYSREVHNLLIQNHHQSAKINHLSQTLNHDSKIIGQNHNLLVQDAKTINENHRILKHNRAVLKHLHEQVHHLFKIEKAERIRELSSAGRGNGEAQLSYYGDTIWHETARRLHHASAEKIRKATNYVLRLNSLRWNGGGAGVDAHKLPVGFSFRIPKNIVQIANR